MARINLRDYYPFYTEDYFIEVDDKIAELLRQFEIREASYKRYVRRYKAYYSLDVDSGIENSILLTVQTPDEIYERRAMQFDAKNKWDNAPLEKVTLSHFNKNYAGFSIP